jgi:hypothetical protein
MTQCKRANADSVGPHVIAGYTGRQPTGPGRSRGFAAPIVMAGEGRPSTSCHARAKKTEQRKTWMAGPSPGPSPAMTMGPMPRFC